MAGADTGEPMGSPVPPLPLDTDKEGGELVGVKEVNLPTDVVELDSTTVINSKPCTPAILGLNSQQGIEEKAPHDDLSPN